MDIKKQIEKLSEMLEDEREKAFMVIKIANAVEDLEADNPKCHYEWSNILRLAGKDLLERAEEAADLAEEIEMEV